MQAIRIRRKLDSETPHLPELKPLVGKHVEIIVLADSEPDAIMQSDSLKGSVLRYDDPFGQAVSPEEWEANR